MDKMNNLSFLQQLRGLICDRDLDNFEDMLAVGARAGLVCSEAEQRALYDATGAFEAYATMPEDMIGALAVALFLDTCDAFAGMLPANARRDQETGVAS